MANGFVTHKTPGLTWSGYRGPCTAYMDNTLAIPVGKASRIPRSFGLCFWFALLIRSIIKDVLIIGLSMPLVIPRDVSTKVNGLQGTDRVYCSGSNTLRPRTSPGLLLSCWMA